MKAKGIQPISLDLDRLERMAESGYYNPYTLFDWPETIPNTSPWMSESLVSLAGTETWDQLTRPQQLSITHYEALNFFSLNVHGIRELLSEVVMRIHDKSYTEVSEFLHHFIGEENEHMWFFAEFCKRYGKIYPPQANLRATSSNHLSSPAQELVVFARILIFEELVDYFNAFMANDMTLPEIARDINRVHHQDESRHVAFGRQLFTSLLSQVNETNPSEIPVIARYLEDYLEYSISTLYNPSVYRDVGLSDALKIRRAAMDSPVRQEQHEKILLRTRRFLSKSGVGREVAR